MTKTKILLDSSVIVSASIQANVASIGATVNHRFHEDSIHLFNIFRKRADEGIGITTKTVRDESFHTLPKAVKNSIQENLPAQKDKQKKLFDETTSIINLCDNKMRDLFSTLLLETPSNEIVQSCVTDVNDMSEYIKTCYKSRYINRMNRNIKAKHRKSKTKPNWFKALKADVYYEQRLQVERETVQMKKFMSKYPNSGDSKILAEAVAIKRQMESDGEDVDFYIASSDTGFFSPPRVMDGAKSDIVTNEIKTRFGIICDFPAEIRRLANL